jgi:hypothetical protein
MPVRDRLREFIRYSELKQLAHNVAALQQEKMFYSLAVLSFFPAEGKTLVCAALALAYAETCRSKVLVVDTTTFQNKGSLALKDCFNGSASLVEAMSLEDLRRIPGGSAQPSSSARPERAPALESEVVAGRSISVTTNRENDFSLIKRVAEDRSKPYGLVLMDTAPLQAKNRSNVDPLLVARLSGASVLVVSRKFLDAPNLSLSLRVLEDPALHLIGMISNEGHDR